MNTSTRAVAKTPRHLWIVGVLSLLWNGFSVFDFVMTNVREPTYVAKLPPAMIDYIDAFPFWVVGAWAMGVGFALLGSLLLLARSIWAAYAFAFSLLGLAATQFYQFGTGLPAGMDTAMNWSMTAAIWIVTVGLLLYALRMRNRRILR